MTTPLDSTPEEDEPWIGYIRVSTWKEEKISPELQESALRAWAKRTGRRLIEPLVVDLDMTGRNFKRKIMGAIRRVEDGEARGIAVWKYSRFGRTRDGVALNLKRLEDAGGALESATEEADARTATGRLQRGILFEFAAYESDVRAEQWKETHDHRRYKLHLPATGRRRFGYIWHPRRLPDGKGGWTVQEERYVAHPEEGPIMAEQYRRYIDGAAFYELTLALNSAGYRTVRGKPWPIQTLIRYMDSGFPAGLLRVHNPSCRCPLENRGSCRNTLFIPGAQEELISAELWQQYQERRQQVRDIPPRARRATYELSGLVRHAACHAACAAASAQRLQDGVVKPALGYLYRCTRRTGMGPVGCNGLWVQRAVIENEVRKWLQREAAPEMDALPAVPQQRTEPANARAQAARERVRLQTEADKLSRALVNLRADRAMNPDDYGPGEYEAARDRIRTQQSANREAMERVAVVEATPHRADYEALIVGTMLEWESLNARERNSILRQLVRRIAVERTEAGVSVEVHPAWEPDPWEPDAAPATA